MIRYLRRRVRDQRFMRYLESSSISPVDTGASFQAFSKWVDRRACTGTGLIWLDAR